MSKKMHINGVAGEVRIECVQLRPLIDHPRKLVPTLGLWPRSALLAPFIPSPKKGMRWQNGKQIPRFSK